MRSAPALSPRFSISRNLLPKKSPKIMDQTREQSLDQKREEAFGIFVSCDRRSLQKGQTHPGQPKGCASPANGSVNRFQNPKSGPCQTKAHGSPSERHGFSLCRPSTAATCGGSASSLARNLAYVFIPDMRIRGNKLRQHFGTFLVVQVDDMHPVLSKPCHAPEKLRLSPPPACQFEIAAPDRCNTSMEREWSYHHHVPIRALPPRPAKGVCLSMNRRITLLHTPIVASTDHLPSLVKSAAPIGMPPSANPILASSSATANICRYSSNSTFCN